MRWYLILSFLILAVATTKASDVNLEEIDDELEQIFNEPVGDRNIIINRLIRQMFIIVRRIVYNGSERLEIPILDPLVLEQFNLNIPAKLININLELFNATAIGAGRFVVEKSDLNLRTLRFDCDLNIPELVISADHYDFTGDFFTAIPLYGKGQAKFIVKNFRMSGQFYLKQSDDGLSIIIDRIGEGSYHIESLDSRLTGVIGGGDIDNVVNAIINDLIMGYGNRFNRAISRITVVPIRIVLNRILEQLNTWRFIAPFVPSN